ncbi:N-acyl homoserine lactonase family protein [Paenibacillus sp. J31TS4]|uniref:N-acyl homoserine lactonase family protein n=1 Tax=Paenibacillus sp. J31TS4 TaxID=2807195 RepID=UPI001B0B2E29|nr:N-acyl homoserine lactonase family protein [Paenibacillus sp. J31TS4]GIP40562.1 N-acyl homoserine lactonase family protein [Paenibacillus sp. J31TS4]
MTTIHIWHTGSVYIDQSLAFKEKTLHPAPFTGFLRPAEKKRWVPVSTYLIEHPKGRILVDTGWHEEMRTQPRKHLGWLSHAMYKGQLPPGQSVREQLAAHGLRDADLDFVLLTHLHSDHVSGLKQVAGAKRILTSEIEWKAAQRDLGYIPGMWQGVGIETFTLKAIPFGPYNRGIDLFDDGSLYLVHTPGHSKGQFSLLVQTGGGWVLLASDVGYAERSWQDFILPGVTSSQEEAAQSLQWVQQFSQRSDCRMVAVNHDPAIVPQTIT